MSTVYIGKIKSDDKEVASRKCMMCGKNFTSQHKGNRICSNCKHGTKYKSATSIGDAIRGRG